MRTVHLRGFALRDAETDAETEGPIPFILATEGRKDDGLDLAMSNVDLARYNVNPVLGYGHDYWGRESLPIGRVDDARTDDGRLIGDLVFDDADDFAVTVERKVRRRFLNAVSVGFQVYDVDKAGVPARWELFETSVVPLPMDPDAVADDGRALAMARALGGIDLVGIEQRLARIEAAVVPRVAVAVHHTGTVDETWDKSVHEGRLTSPVPLGTARDFYAWYDEAEVEDDAIPKSAGKFPHHEVSESGTPGRANLSACRNGLARLSQADIPDAERDAVRSHLQAHLDDAEDNEDDGRGTAALDMRRHRLRLYGA